MEISFERAAANGEMMPDGLPLEDQLLFLSLRSLYGAYKSGHVGREVASEEKGKLLHEYEKRKRQANSARKQSANTVSMWRDMEGLVSLYRKNRTLEIADKLADATQGKVIDWKQIGEGD